VGAQVTATEEHTGAKSQTLSDATGKYTIPFLQPGDYDINATSHGFKQFIRKAIHLAAVDHPVIDIAMVLGSASESVEIVGAFFCAAHTRRPGGLDWRPASQTTSPMPAPRLRPSTSRSAS
jgi:hypothetical protein